MAECNPEETIVHGYAWLISQPDAGAVIAFSTNSVHRFSLSFSDKSQDHKIFVESVAGIRAGELVSRATLWSSPTHCPNKSNCLRKRLIKSRSYLEI